jgi:CRISPR system Cascade subunit CasE
MYLSRCELNPARRGARTLLGSPQAMHAAVLASYPSREAEGPGRVLWRVDQLSRATWLYILGPTLPDLTHVVEQGGWPASGQAWDTRPYEGLLASVSTGRDFAFRLTANPTLSTRIKGREHSQRLGHVTTSQQLWWLLDRAEGWGFAVPETPRGPAAVVVSRAVRRFRRGSDWVTLATATFEGQLRVADAPTFRQSLVGGLGPGKAYGCGLLTLAPVAGRVT